MDPIDGEDTVRIRGQASGTHSISFVEPQPLPDAAMEEVLLLHRVWSNYCATLKHNNENLRHQVKALLEENAALRHSINEIAGR